MRPNALFAVLILAVSVSHAQPSKLSPQARKEHNDAYHEKLREHEVTYSAQVWKFSRIYPLLDGLLQDISATQVASLSLNANGPNGVALDATQQSLQLQLQYSQLAGVQNASVAQAATANSTYQTNLVQQETALMQNLASAYGQVSTAQTNLNNLNASGTASATDIATATQALQGANANLTAVGNAITNFKNLAAPPTTPAASAVASAPTLPSLTSSALPSGLTTAVTSNASNAPSFPSTKQLDNQINILWDRLARLVGAMSRPDNMSPDDRIYLVKFDTGIYPLERQKQLLDVTYSVNCGGTVIDMFPRNAALNIIEDKYKDSAFGFGAVLSWFGVGGSIAYNREHLKASQLLGQSSYISGHGIGQSEFGWLFGIGLGDDSISPGPRNTFALIWTPKSCAEPKISVASAKWTKAPKFAVAFPEPIIPANAAWKLPGDPTDTCTHTCITGVEFNRNEYDPTSGKPAPVTVRITLSREMDQQQTVSVNGMFIQRVRDNFGRAISPTVSATNGVLETAQMGVGTWIPTSPTTMLLTVDTSLFGNRFPQILLSSPQSVIDVAQDRAKDARVIVSGNALKCDKDPCVLPSLGILKTTPKNLGVARWIAPAASGGSPIDKLCITVLDPDTGASPASITTGGVPTVQVISSADSQVWGPDAEVNVIAADNTSRRLSCDPRDGSRLICEAPDSKPDGKGNRPSLELRVVDQRHGGGVSIRGTVFTKECTNDDARSEGSCRRPLIWQTSPPKLFADNSGQLNASKWRMWVRAVNVESSDKAQLGTLTPDVTNGAMFNCAQAPAEPCTTTFTIAPGQRGIISDWMTFQVWDKNGKQLGSPAAITNVLENIKPIISQITDDRTSWFGRNLLFDTIRVGASSPFHVECLPDGSQCRGDGHYGSATGFLYFVANQGLAFPFNQVNTSGTNTGIVYTPPKQNPSDNANKQILGANLFDKLETVPQLKEMFAMRAVQ